MSIGVAASFRNEVNALPGFLEMAARFFDDILLVDCSFNMTPSTDGSLDIIRKWGIPDPALWDLSRGFGVVRTQLLNTSRTDWTVIMDIDERMHVTMPMLICHGDERYPAVQKPNLTVQQVEPSYSHRDLLVDRIRRAEEQDVRAVRFQRRHWFDCSYTKPCENWNQVKDYQLRCMKSNAGMGFTPEPKMHERAWDFGLNQEPAYIADDEMRGPFLDHLHCHFKPMESDQRAEDIAVYDKLDGR